MLTGQRYTGKRLQITRVIFIYFIVIVLKISVYINGKHITKE